MLNSISKKYMRNFKFYIKNINSILLSKPLYHFMFILVKSMVKDIEVIRPS